MDSLWVIQDKSEVNEMKEVIVLAFNNCLSSGIFGVLDVFEICNDFWKRQEGKECNFFEVKLVTADGDPVRGFNSTIVNPVLSVNEVERSDLIIVPPIMNQIDKVINDNAPIIPWLKPKKIS